MGVIARIDDVTLVGQRAKLIPLERQHAPALFEAGQDPRIWAYMPALPETLADIERVVDDALRLRDSRAEFPFVIIDQETGKVIGSTRFLDIQLANRGIEIGWTWLSPAVWRTRVNTECKYLLLRHCFEELDMIRVCLKTDARNIRSQQAVARIGGTREGVLRSHRIMPDGYVRDTVYFSILVHEWSGVKARLESKLDSTHA